MTRIRPCRRLFSTCNNFIEPVRFEIVIEKYRQICDKETGDDITLYECDAIKAHAAWCPFNYASRAINRPIELRATSERERYIIVIQYYRFQRSTLTRLLARFVTTKRIVK